MRMPWEEVLAFIVGPAFVLTIIVSGQAAFAPAPVPPEVPTEVLVGESPLSELTEPTKRQNSGSIWLLLLGITIVSIITYIVNAPARFRFNPGLLFKSYFQGPRYKTRQAQSSQTLYLETAIRLGALVAAADGHADANELTTLKRIFGLTDEAFPNAQAVYQSQLSQPQSMRTITKSFVQAYGSGSTNCEPLIFGMCCIALTDQTMTPAEVGMIRMTADLLGLRPADTKRIMMSAGYYGANTGQSRQQSQSSSQPRSEREEHLKTLELPANASKKAIRKAWRTLVMKYHPDKLASQNLSSREAEAADDRIQAINEAYDWLKEYGA